MARRLLLVCLLLSAISRPALAAESLVRVVVFPGVQAMAIFAAQEKGLFVKRGLKVDLTFTANSTQLREGLAKGTYDVAHTASDNAVAMVELAKDDVVVIMGGDNSLNGLYVQPGISSIADLRGKNVAVDAPNTAYALQLYKMLQLNGLQRSDYSVKVVGGVQLRLDAMRNDKSIAATMLNLPYSLIAERDGLRKFGTAVQALGPYQGTSAFGLRNWARANQDTVVHYIQAYVEGLRWAKNKANKAEAATLLVKYLKMQPDLAAQCYDIFADPAGGFATDARLDIDGFRNVLKLRAEMEGQWGGTPPPEQKYIDLSYYSRALSGL
jgi:ABC-type nitrate/sulfonate/bicarbonate transport system substrate-binding protein